MGEITVKRVAIVGIIVEDKSLSEDVQRILHEFSELIVGRMGLPDVAEDTNVITLVVKGSQKEISALSGKLGNLDSVTSKVIYSKKELQD